MLTIYTDELKNGIAKYIENGVSDRDACELIGLGKTTFYLWQSDDPKNPLSPEQKADFTDTIKKAKAKRKLYLVNKIMVAAEKTWQAAAWYLERVYPEEFAEHKKVEMIDAEKEFKRIMSAIKEAHNEK